MRWILVLVLFAARAGAQEAVPPRPIDFARIERKIAKLPALKADKPLYGLFLFGLHGEKRVWAVLDKSDKTAATYDVLYLDRNADGDLTQPGERLPGNVTKNVARTQAEFPIGRFVDPGTRAVHTEFKITYLPGGVRFSMLWRGEKISYGPYGPTNDSYANFEPSIEKAPILVPGYDRPFQFQHWMSDQLKAGETKWFKVFVGNRGSRVGAFSSVDDKFLPPDEFVLATLIYRDGNGKEQRYQAKLTERC